MKLCEQLTTRMLAEMHKDFDALSNILRPLIRSHEPHIILQKLILYRDIQLNVVMLYVAENAGCDVSH